MNLNANAFVKQMKPKSENSFKLATVTEILSGKPYLTFYGEDVQSEKSYKRLSNYEPAIGDVVCVAKINKSWLILGKVV